MDNEFTITNGTIEYSRTVRPAEFASNAERVILTFTVAEGSNPLSVLDKVGLIAQTEVDTRLGLPGPTTAIPQGQPAAPEPATPHVGRPRKSKGAQVESTLEPETDPLASLTGGGSSTDNGGGSTVSDPLAGLSDADLGLPPEPKATVFTDDDLNKAAQAASMTLRGRDGNIDKLRALIVQYGGKMLSIPADKRADFITATRLL